MNSRILSIFGVAALLASAHLYAVPAKKASRGAKEAEHSHVAPHERGLPSVRRTTAKDFSPVRTTPVKRGEFQVDLVVIAFPDCHTPESAEKVCAALTSYKGSYTIADYYKEYSQGITWPVLAAYPAVYMAPHPYGYYCRHDTFTNLIGFKGDGYGRAAKLREDALRFAQSKGGLKKKGDFTCYVYCNSLNGDPEVLEKVVRPFYPPKPSPERLAEGAEDKLRKYKPKVPWRDPLWPNSIPQVMYPGGALVHEIGHLLGAPDFYHASEEHDGVGGTPCLPWSYGPTGPAYCRYIYNAYVPAAAYPKITAPGEYTLAPRSAKFPFKDNEGLPPLGLLVPSSHPNYVFCIEYCHNDSELVGNPSAEGLLIHAINVTMSSPMMGPPDLCYTYRTGDRDHKGVGGSAYFMRPGDTFDAKSDPAAILPNLLPAGIAISNVRTDSAAGTCTFKLDVQPAKLTRAELDFSLLPQTELIELCDWFPTSFRARLNVRYRGEPLMTEYGICYGLKKDPTEKTGQLFPLHHRDRYDARILDLKPGILYYVRGYARNANGIRYSRNQKGITLPKEDSGLPFTSTLFGPSDHLLSNWYYQKWYFGTHGDNIINSANPVFAFMALANYYRVMPGPAQKYGSRGGDALDLTLVHSHPTESRPKFRMAETEKLYRAVRRVVADAGLTQSDFIMEDEDNGKGKGKKKRTSPRRTTSGKPDKFGELSPWVKKCAAALGIKSPETTFFPCSDADDINKLAPEIRRWIFMSQPVLVVRENKTMKDDISERWPLDIAIIDGLGGDPLSFHVVFPGGRDRGTRHSGEMKLEDVLHRTTQAIVMFYRPAAPVKSR